MYWFETLLRLMMGVFSERSPRSYHVYANDDAGAELDPDG